MKRNRQAQTSSGRPHTTRILLRHKLFPIFILSRQLSWLIWEGEKEEGVLVRDAEGQEKKTEEGKVVLKHNRSIHPLTSGELSPNNRASPNALKSTFEDVLVHPWIHSLPIGGCLLSFVHICVCALFFFIFVAPFKFP